MIKFWIMPCNTKQFDIVKHFNNNEYVYWAKKKNININDNVYIYLAAPYGEIRYKCIVVDNDISSDYIQKNASYAFATSPSGMDYKYIKLKKQIVFDNGVLNRDFLKEKGLGQFQVLSRMGRSLKEYIMKLENNIEEDNDNGD